MAANAEFTTVLIDGTTVEPGVVLPKPKPGTYFLRVRTVDADGFSGPYGEAQQFVIEGRPWWNYLPFLLLLLVH